MSNSSDFENHIRLYEKKYRRPDFADLNISGFYDLFPQENNQVQNKWPDEWPGSNNPGVYVVFDSNLNVIYVGKASFKSCIGNRLSSYFGYDDNRKCKILHNWDIAPRFIRTVSVPIQTKFEASAIEEYLIEKLKPTLNKIGIC